MEKAGAGEHPVILFDGVCNLCNFWVNFIIDRDPQARFRFAALQSDAGRAVMTTHGLAVPSGDPESILFIDSGTLYSESTAALRIARHLHGLWKCAAILLVVPRPIRDAGYRFIARHRYRWFGRSDQCRVPTAELRRRFL